MLRKVLLAAPAVAAPVAVVTVPRVFAAEGEPAPEKTAAVVEKTDMEVKEQDPILKQLKELKDRQKDRRVLIGQLPLYGEPEAAELVYIPEQEESFRRHVSTVRKVAWKELDRFEGAWNIVKKNYRTTKKYAKEFAVYLREDAGALPRATFITVSGLGGIVAGYKGGVIRKTLFAGLGMTAAASVCYPEHAVDISKKGWLLTKDQAEELWKQARGTKANTDQTQQVSETKPEVQVATDSTADTKHAVKVATKEELETKEQPKKDFGMSKEEDKNMYSTRSS